MKLGPLQIPEPHVIEEIQKRRLPPDERVQPEIPLPIFPEPTPKKEERVITIQL